MLRRLTLTNLLSFGPEPVTLELENLNVLIGPNGSGKSNFIEALSLLRAMPVSGRHSDRDLAGVVRSGGGVTEWIWKGAPRNSAAVKAVVSVSGGLDPLEHSLSFYEQGQRFHTTDETIFREGTTEPLYSRYPKEPKKGFAPAHIESSVLAERRDPDSYPEYALLADFYEGIRIYRNWTFGRNSKLREPQKTDLRTDRLEEDLSNLGPVLSRLRKAPKAKNEILERLKVLYRDFSDYDVSLDGGYAQVYFTEGDFTIPAVRLSDGTLRYLCLLAILCDPAPPPLICIEEPELGLHPDILPTLADLLAEFSERTQLIVTTHSDILVDAMTARPQAVVVCEKDQGRTRLSRLDPNELAAWLDEFRLGQLWMRGQLGGTRW